MGVSPFDPSNNKPGSGAWWLEMLKRFPAFLLQGVKEVLGIFGGKR